MTPPLTPTRWKKDLPLPYGQHPHLYCWDETGIYLISYSAVASITTSTGTVGVELENNSTPVPGSESQATIATTSNVANLAATVLVNVTGTATITLASTENNVTLTEAAIVIQKLN